MKMILIFRYNMFLFSQVFKNIFISGLDRGDYLKSQVLVSYSRYINYTIVYSYNKPPLWNKHRHLKCMNVYLFVCLSLFLTIFSSGYCTLSLSLAETFGYFFFQSFFLRFSLHVYLWLVLSLSHSLSLFPPLSLSSLRVFFQITFIRLLHFWFFFNIVLFFLKETRDGYNEFPSFPL